MGFDVIERGEHVGKYSRTDPETGMVKLVICGDDADPVTGDVARTETIIGPIKHGAVIMDEQGNRADCTETGALKVQETGGSPQSGTVTTAADTWTAVVTTATRCTHLWAYGITKNLSLSLSGGPAIHFIIVAAAPAISVGGLDIPAGSTLSVATRVAGENGTAYISVW
jgi:hypothetical protein